MKQNLYIPVAIVIGGALIASASIFGDGNSGQLAQNNPNSHQQRVTDNANLPVQRTENPHIFGNPDAAISIVEFSDFECPFCSRLHPTLERLVEESDGAVNWEYRHLPLPNHRNAVSAAIASECVAKLAGNDSFWQFSSALFSNQRGINNTFIENTAVEVGVEKDAFQTCIADKSIASAVTTDRNTAIAQGGNGTPFSVIVYADGSTKPVSGALPYEQWTYLLAQ